MSRRSNRWDEGVATQAFLVCMDISGFSNNIDPNRLLEQRLNFFRAVELSPVFVRAKKQGLIRVHFLGDELRLAFHIAVGVESVTAFIDDVFSRLRRRNHSIPNTSQTHIRGCSFAGPVTWARWHDCQFLDGQLPLKAQAWLSLLEPDEFAVDSNFKNYCDVAGAPAHRLSRRVIGSEVAFSFSG